jgi:integrase/recombinase XerD
MQAFFTDRVINQLRASPHTIVSYRDTMRLLRPCVMRRFG